jgi:hypothetical protein
MKPGDILLPKVPYPDDHYRLVSLDETEARVQAVHTNPSTGKPPSQITLEQLRERFAPVMCKNCGKNPATEFHGRTLSPEEIAENQAWSDSFKTHGWHTGHCPHLELPQQPRCQSCK